MIIKAFEVRDRLTCIPVIAIAMGATGPIQKRYLHRCGYPQYPSPPSIVMMRLADQRASSDPYWWNDRTHQVAHNFICDNFDSLKEGDVIDVRVILGETTKPASPEIAG